jgi:hypothetical protein
MFLVLELPALRGSNIDKYGANGSVHPSQRELEDESHHAREEAKRRHGSERNDQTRRSKPCVHYSMK